MLRRFEVRNIVLIDTVALDFAPGFCVLTGETGAGKSILLDAIGLLRGDRADAGLLRKDAEQGSALAAFDLPDPHPVRGILAGQGIEITDELLLKRILTRDGKSRAFINDQSVSVALLRDVGRMVVDLHGQFDTGDLFTPAQHRDWLDDFADARNLRVSVADAWADWQGARANLEQAEQAAMDTAREQDSLRADLEAITALAPQAGEEEKLVEKKALLASRAQIVEGLTQASALLSGEGGADEKIAQAARVLDKLRPKITISAEAWISALDGALAQLRETAESIQSMLFDASEGNESLEEIEDRLYALRAMARRMNCAVADLSEKQTEIESRLSLIQSGDKTIKALRENVTQAEARYFEEARKLSEKRKMGAQSLAKVVMAELPPLKLEKAQFVVGVNVAEPGPTGIDAVQFLLAANPGTEPGPIDKVASGGELSRVMLAVKVVLAQRADTHLCLVFDEVDSGIGGAVAAAVGERLARLARTRQVLSVTHAPQVAARATQHWIVKKAPHGKAIVTTVESLETEKERREEIARMLSGEQITEEARKAADRLLEARAA